MKTTKIKYTYTRLRRHGGAPDTQPYKGGRKRTGTGGRGGTRTAHGATGAPGMAPPASAVSVNRNSSPRKHALVPQTRDTVRTRGKRAPPPPPPPPASASASAVAPFRSPPPPAAVSAGLIPLPSPDAVRNPKPQGRRELGRFTPPIAPPASLTSVAVSGCRCTWPSKAT